MPSYRLLLARVRAAFFAAAERWALLRWRAAERACLESALFEAADRPSRPSAFLIARERLREGALRFAPFFSSRLALRRVSFEAAPFFGGGNRTPARRAFDKPIAIACLVDRAPCLPSRMCSIVSRTNSPACVEGDLPSRLSRRARSKVFFSGMAPSFLRKCAARQVPSRRHSHCTDAISSTRRASHDREKAMVAQGENCLDLSAEEPLHQGCQDDRPRDGEQESES